MKKEKIAEFQYLWLKELLKPLFNRLTFKNVRKYKSLVTHNRNVKFKNLNQQTKQIYLEFAEELTKNETL